MDIMALLMLWSPDLIEPHLRGRCCFMLRLAVLACVGFDMLVSMHIVLNIVKSGTVYMLKFIPKMEAVIKPQPYLS